mmetsp:Transcript_80996/g.142835  ORF Transcript_80996/g.142835 Transcript_80996/m.142835 type:complete len:90 (-) Transcript_80996:147-416(-)
MPSDRYEPLVKVSQEQASLEEQAKNDALHPQGAGLFPNTDAAASEARPAKAECGQWLHTLEQVQKWIQQPRNRGGMMLTPADPYRLSVS